MALRPLDHAHKEFDHQLAIAKDLAGTPEGRLILDKLGKILLGIPNGEALGFIVGAPSAIVLFSPDDFYTIYIQDYKATHSMPFLGATVKLHIHSLAQDKMCLWWQTNLAQGSLRTVYGVQIDWLVWLIFPFVHYAARRVQLLRYGRCSPNNPSVFTVLDGNKHGL